jgi:BirA family biotin operon repressor/biotin-[acetyl-CoA-carboxylase] ligase
VFSNEKYYRGSAIKQHHPWTIHFFDCVDSTNKQAFRLLDEIQNNNALHQTVIIAKEQTNGRGRSGKAWQSPQGNVAMSLILLEEGTLLGELGILSFVTAVALRETIVALSNDEIPALQLKWPNDVLYQGEKLAGILLESKMIEDKTHAVIVGVGVNLARLPKGIEQPVSCLQQILPETTVSVDEFIKQFLEKFMSVYTYWHSHGSAGVMAKWKSHAYGLGKEVIARLPKETITGVFHDIDHTGALHLKCTKGEMHKITCGEVFFS